VNKGVTLGILFLCIFPTYAVEFSLYGDVRARWSNLKSEASSFQIGALDLFSSQSIGENSSLFVELLLEPDESHFVLDVERMFLQKQVKPWLQIGMGRMHSPFSFWNSNYHHGVIQDTISRPLLLQLDNGLEGMIPNHAVGLSLSGSQGLNDVFVYYHAVVSNSPSIDSSEFFQQGFTSLRVDNYQDVANSKTTLARFAFLQQQGVWQLGLSWMQTNVFESGNALTNLSALDFGSVIFQKQLVALDIRLSKPSAYIMAEWVQHTSQANFYHATLAPVFDSRQARYFYVQLGLRFWHRFTPVYRFEQLVSQPDNAYLNMRGINPQIQHIATLSYELAANSAIRLEYNVSQSNTVRTKRRLSLQWYVLLF